MSGVPVRRIVISGGESTGKTTLAAALAQALDTSWSAEFSREYANAAARALTEADVLPIMRGQRALEDEAIARARHGIVVHDTDLLSTLVYARHYYRFSPTELEQLVAERVPALVLLLEPDVPWVADGIRDRPADREALHGLFVDTLREFGRSWNPIAGEDRLADALRAVGAPSA